MIKNITFSAEDSLIQRARQRANSEHVTLNDLIRRWLEQYTMQASAADRYDELMNQLSYSQATRKFSREEMNERR